jgi:prepilin-type N-terminal cleavage/methylation domain-containing protein
LYWATSAFFEDKWETAMVKSGKGYKMLRRVRSGFTLVEIVISLAIFAVTLGATAQGLGYAYGLVTLQNQRVVAANDCRAVISGLRNVVAADPDTTGCPDTANKFPCLPMEYVSTFPAKRVPFSGLYTLRNETITITLKSSTGSAAVNGTGASTSTNPLYTKVTVQWIGPRGITYTEVMSTIITNV